MDAEITITTKNGIDPGAYLSAVQASFPCTESRADVLALMDESHRDAFRLVHLIHWYTSRSKILLIEQLTNRNICKAYLIAIGARSLPGIKEAMHETVTGFDAILIDRRQKRKNRNKITSVKVTISAEGTTIQQLSRITLGSRFWKSIASDFVYKFTVPAITLGISWAFNLDLEKAAIAAAASTAGFILWLLIGAGIISRTFPYE